MSEERAAGKTITSFPYFATLFISLGAAFQVWLLWGSLLPLGVNEEWVWPRAFERIPTFLDALPAAIAGVFLIAYLLWQPRTKTGRLRNAAWLSGLMLLGGGWSIAVISASPAGGGMARAPFVVFYPRTSGYFHQALYEAEELPEFLSRYQTEISDESDPDNYLHIGTHPPGLTLTYRLLIDLCEQSETLTNFLKRTRPQSVADAIDFIRQRELQAGKDFSEGAAAALWLSIIIGHLLAVLTAIPLYLLVSGQFSISTARLLAGMWLLVPAMLIFIPKSDASFPCLAMCLQLLWFQALDKNSWLYGILTAIVFVFAATLSLAFVTVGVILFFQMLYIQYHYKRGWKPTLSGLLTGIMSVLLIHDFMKVNLFGVWLQNFENHGRFYHHNVRTYWSWLFVNPIEFAIAVGLPVTVACLFGLKDLIGQRCPEKKWMIFGLVVWSLLWLSGKNLGEGARLWIFLMPYALLAASPFIERLTQSSIDRRRATLGVLLLLQALVCFLTAIQIDGFGFMNL